RHASVGVGLAARAGAVGRLADEDVDAVGEDEVRRALRTVRERLDAGVDRSTRGRTPGHLGGYGTLGQLRQDVGSRHSGPRADQQEKQRNADKLAWLHRAPSLRGDDFYRGADHHANTGATHLLKVLESSCTRDPGGRVYEASRRR